MGKILSGTASWTDPTLLESGWYPETASTPEDRLRYYSSRFPLVEVDSTYYSLPSERVAELWTTRTPDHFTFDFKAFRLFTGHPTPVRSLPKAVREELQPRQREKGTVYQKELPRTLVNDTWDMFRRALLPVQSSGKLGAVFFQFPKWFYFSRENMQYIFSVKERLPEYALAVEFRQASWMNEHNADRTLTFLRENDIAYTCVDEPQGTKASVPPVAAATSDLAVVRFHGRKQDTWDKPGVGVEERFRYLYSENELSEWVPKVERIAEDTREVHILMNNCYADYGVRNAAQLRLLLERDGAEIARAG